MIHPPPELPEERTIYLAHARGQICSYAQRRRADHLQSLVGTLMNFLSPQELDECLGLHYVVWMGELNDLAGKLIRFGCNPYSTDLKGDSVLHYCVKGCNLQYLKEMHRLYGNKIFTPMNNNHFSLMLTAAAETPDDKTYAILALMEWLYLRGASLESQDILGRTPLMWASRRGSSTVVQYLLSRGANLSHRDHMGHTVLHMSCASGDDTTVYALCEKGAINFIESKSNDDSSENTATRICWNRGHYFLAISLRKCKLQKIIFNSVFIFRSMFAWHYWWLCIFNGFLFGVTAKHLIQIEGTYRATSIAWILICIFTQLLWIITFLSDPGYVKKNVIRDQSNRCSCNIKKDIDSPPVFSPHPYSQQHKLIVIEKAMAKIGLKLIELNKKWVSDDRHTIPYNVEKEYDECVSKLRKAREAIYRIMDKISLERIQECPSGYIQNLFEDGDFRKVCITCRIIKPFRGHHCSDCGHCIARFDHHCVWVDTCVGIGNQRSFYLFMVSLTTAILFHWYILFEHYSYMLENPVAEGLVGFIAEKYFYVSIANAVFNLLWLGFVGYLLCRTTKSMLTNLTFYEYLKKPSHVMRRFKGRVNSCCWEMRGLTFTAILRNIYGFFAQDMRWDKFDFFDSSAKYDNDEYIMMQDYGNSVGTNNMTYIPIAQQDDIETSNAHRI